MSSTVSKTFTQNLGELEDLIHASPALILELYGDAPSQGKNATLFTQDPDGWAYEEGRIYATRYHEYNSSFCSNEYINLPGERFTCTPSKWLLLGLTPDNLATMWYATVIGLLNRYSYKGRTLHHNKPALDEDYQYNDLSKAVPSEFKFQISTDGLSVEAYIDNVFIVAFEHTPGTRLYFYGTGVGADLEVRNLQVHKFGT
ncbi:MAG: hypothetical protein F6K54_16250 [Okeania sp. SIO3B5]|uniref:hypothetical protein n=1 Tax=Okeania sp. SIO3B5 TaxID=2607811 RepID=UPI0013FFF4E9|nr:hypothetical protein [Okeania sp. SIO3B5]NEO54496.1 hypothetical protein [Okeania sp. SIO3B5]